MQFEFRNQNLVLGNNIVISNLKTEQGYLFFNKTVSWEVICTIQRIQLLIVRII